MIVLVTGGAGYKGSVLVPKLIEAGHDVVVYDTCWFGCKLKEHKHLYDVLKGDIRDGSLPVGMDAIIHLAGIANDPCGELDAKLTWEVNVLATMRLAEHAVRHGVKQFIFASSGSVYGIKGGKPVVEEDELAPVSDYNKTKQVAERVLLSYSDKMAIQILRPATVCGVSPRMRLDTMVNMLTMQALTKGEITAHCGEHGANLMRPNIHIEDVTDLYCWMLERPHLTGAYNAGFENLSAMETAELIAKHVPAEIKITTVKDQRSYAVDSSKILNAGFQPKNSVADAIEDIVVGFNKGRIKDQDDCYNLRHMRANGWVSETR
jgi:nucleoside-diphosphate-sugar epimerase